MYSPSIQQNPVNYCQVASGPMRECAGCWGVDGGLSLVALRKFDPVTLQPKMAALLFVTVTFVWGGEPCV
jgi:hypothetical protein